MGNDESEYRIMSLASSSFRIAKTPAGVRRIYTMVKISIFGKKVDIKN